MLFVTVIVSLAALFVTVVVIVSLTGARVAVPARYPPAPAAMPTITELNAIFPAVDSAFLRVILLTRFLPILHTFSKRLLWYLNVHLYTASEWKILNNELLC